MIALRTRLKPREGQLDLDSAEALVETGNLLASRGELVQAAACYRRALAQRPVSVAVVETISLMGGPPRVTA